MLRFSLLLAATAPLLASSAFAQAPAAGETSLTIKPPAGYEAKQMPGRGANAVIYSVKKPAEPDTGCQVGYAAAPQNAGFAQADINKRMSSKEHQDLAKAAISGIYETNAVAPFEHGDVTGMELISDIKPREGIPPRAQEIRNMMVIMETPKGRTSVVCVGEKADFDKRREEFHQVALGVTLPK